MNYIIEIEALLFCIVSCLPRSAGNKYLMREMARIGCGVSEYMNPKARFNWGKQVR